MGERIRIRVEGRGSIAHLEDNETARAILGRLPLDLRLNRWGDEYYGSVGDDLDVGVAPDAHDVLEVGALAYWPPGNAFCVFFGPTPASAGDEPRAASAVNPIGRIAGPVDAWKSFEANVGVRLERDAPS